MSASLRVIHMLRSASGETSPLLERNDKGDSLPLLNYFTALHNELHHAIEECAVEVRRQTGIRAQKPGPEEVEGSA